VDARLTAEVAALPHRVVYVTVVGEHLYGTAAADTEPDLRGCHVLPARDVVGLRAPPESYGFTGHRDGLDFEFLSYDLRQLCLLLLKKNGQVLEHVLSPLVVATSPEHEELTTIARACASRHMAHHYLSHAALQWDRAREPTARSALLALRVLWTAAHLMRTGDVECDVARLAAALDVPWAADLVARRRADADTPLDAPEAHRRTAEYARWRGLVEEARDRGPLPPAPPDDARRALDDLVVRVRLTT
jgi:predicted nucleotidyltransferase